MLIRCGIRGFIVSGGEVLFCGWGPADFFDVWAANSLNGLFLLQPDQPSAYGYASHAAVTGTAKKVCN